MELLTVTYPGHNKALDRRICALVGCSAQSAGYDVNTGTRDLQFNTAEFDPATTGAALSALGAAWGTRCAE